MIIEHAENGKCYKQKWAKVGAALEVTEATLKEKREGAAAGGGESVPDPRRAKASKVPVAWGPGIDLHL